MGTNDLLSVIENMEKERGISRDSLVQMVEAALLSASRKSVGPAKDLRVEIDRKTLNIKAFAKVEVVERVTSRHTQISLTAAHKYKRDAKAGDIIEIEVPAREFGRIAAQTAKQAIIQKIRHAEKEIVVKEYKDREGDIVGGTIIRLDHGDVIIDLGRVEAIMPARERVQTEEYQIGDRIRAYVLSVQDHASGHHIVLSRSHPNFVRRLFELEISELADKTIEIKEIAREAGYRTKIAVISNDEKVDPVGACVGMKGSRVQNVVQELRGEKIDIISWHVDAAKFVCNALSPAEISRVIIDEENNAMEVIVPDEFLSVAIGKRGQNVRLASKLSGWRLDVMSETRYSETMKVGYDSLVGLPGVGVSMADALYEKGFFSAEELSNASPEDLTQIRGIGEEKAHKLIEAATQMLAHSHETVENPEDKPSVKMKTGDTDEIESAPDPDAPEKTEDNIEEKAPEPEAPVQSDS